MHRINRVQKLARREEKDIVKRIFFLSVVSVVLIITLLTVGVSALGKFADFLEIVFGDKSQKTEEVSSLSPPILKAIPDYVLDENIKISGFSPNGEFVEIYLDGEKVGESKIESGKFEYELSLKEGVNEISAKTVFGNTQSDFSQSEKVILDKTIPKLEITTPVDGQSFFGNNRIPVEGKTEPNAQVFINGFLANVDAEGNFDVLVPIAEGDSDLEAKAVDEAGNTTTLKVRVNFRK